MQFIQYKAVKSNSTDNIGSWQTELVIQYRKLTNIKERSIQKYTSKSCVTLHTLDNLINRAIYRIFGCSQSADVNYIRLMFDLPDMEVCVQRRFCSFSRQFHSCLSWAEVITYVHAM